MSIFKVSHTSPATDIYRSVSVRDALSRTPGSGGGVHIMAETITPRRGQKVAGMVLEKDDARALAHDILARIGEPVAPPVVPYVPFADRIGQYVQDENGQIVRIVRASVPLRQPNRLIKDNGVAVREDGTRVEIYNDLHEDGRLLVEWWKPVSVRVTESWEVQA